MARQLWSKSARQAELEDHRSLPVLPQFVPSSCDPMRFSPPLIVVHMSLASSCSALMIYQSVIILQAHPGNFLCLFNLQVYDFPRLNLVLANSSFQGALVLPIIKEVLQQALLLVCWPLLLQQQC